MGRFQKTNDRKLYYISLDSGTNGQCKMVDDKYLNEGAKNNPVDDGVSTNYLNIYGILIVICSLILFLFFISQFISYLHRGKKNTQIEEKDDSNEEGSSAKRVQKRRKKQTINLSEPLIQ